MENMEPSSLPIPMKSGAVDMDNHYYTLNYADIYSTNLDANKAKIEHPTQSLSPLDSRFPIIFEMPACESNPSTSNSMKFPSASSSSVIHRHSEQHRRSTTCESPERQLSPLDPKSSRVTTILVWQNLTVSTKEDDQNGFFQRFKSNKNSFHERKRLIKNISGAITGGLWAVMGPSGSGKSTLLNTLACRLDVNTTYEGEIHLNGAPYDNAELKRIAGYVMQDDLLNGHLTVEETLMYTAELRLPRIFTKKEQRQRVEEVMTDMGLTEVRHVVVGTHMIQGISGSERKKLCIGMELLNRPQLLFLDEPTTGLDSVTALELVQRLHALAHEKQSNKAMTIVCSIHQPQSKIFNLFDSIILLKAGHVIYQGNRKQAMETYRLAGFPCPLYTNPADHLLDVITPSRSDPTKIVGATAITIEQQEVIDAAILAAQPPISIDLNMGYEKRLTHMMNYPLNPLWHNQVEILLRRNFQEQSRKKTIFFTSLIQSIIMAILIGTVFLKIGHGQDSIIHRGPVLFFCVVNQGVFGALMVINSFPVERALTLRERASGTYFASAYFMAKILTETIVQLPVPILFSCIVYFLVGLQATAEKFFLFMLLMVLCSTTSTSIALMISAICRTTDLSVTVLPMVLEVCRLFGGFFLAPSRIPKYFSWLSALSYVNYNFVGTSLNELEDLKLTCTANQNTTNTCITDGETVIREFGYDYINIGVCIQVLLGFIIFCRACAFLSVRFLKH